MTDQLFTETDCKIILSQIERRAKCRQAFLKARTDPCKHTMEAGVVVKAYTFKDYTHYSNRPATCAPKGDNTNAKISRQVRLMMTRKSRERDCIVDSLLFDEAVARYTSMKATQFERFNPNKRNIRFTVLALIPMFLYGGAVWVDRETRERQIRCGLIKPRDRLFKFQ